MEWEQAVSSLVGGNLSLEVTVCPLIKSAAASHSFLSGTFPFTHQIQKEPLQILEVITFEYNKN